MCSCDELSRYRFMGVGVGQIGERIIFGFRCDTAGGRLGRDGAGRGCDEVSASVPANEAF